MFHLCSKFDAFIKKSCAADFLTFYLHANETFLIIRPNDANALFQKVVSSGKDFEVTRLLAE